MTKLYKFLLTILFLCSCANAILYAGDSEDKYSITAGEYVAFTNTIDGSFAERMPDVLKSTSLPNKSFSPTVIIMCYNNFLFDLEVLREIAPKSYYYTVKKGLGSLVIENYAPNWYYRKIEGGSHYNDPILFSTFGEVFSIGMLIWPNNTNYCVNISFFDTGGSWGRHFLYDRYFVSYVGHGWAISAIEIKNFKELIAKKLLLYNAIDNIIGYTGMVRNPTTGYKYSGGVLSPLLTLQRSAGEVYYYSQELKSKYINMSFTYFEHYYFSWIKQYILLLQYVHTLKSKHRGIYAKIKKDKAMVFLVQKTYVQYRDLLSDLRTSLQNAIPKTKDGKKKGLYQKVEMILGKMLSDSANDKLIKDLSGSDEFMGNWDIESHIRELKSFGLEVKKIE